MNMYDVPFSSVTQTIFKFSVLVLWVKKNYLTASSDTGLETKLELRQGFMFCDICTTD
jgi:hypothetical protein